MDAQLQFGVIVLCIGTVIVGIGAYCMTQLPEWEKYQAVANVDVDGECIYADGILNNRHHHQCDMNPTTTTANDVNAKMTPSVTSVESDIVTGI